MNLAMVRLTPAVKYLLILNCLVYLIQLFGGGVPESYLALTCRWGAAWQIWRFFTYAFLHSSIIGLLFSSLALFFIGPPLESRLGTCKFLLVYLGSILTGAVAAFCTGVILAPTIGSAVIYGSSAGILGVLAYLIRLEPEAIFNVWLLILIPIKAAFLWWVTAASLLAMLLSRLENSGSLQADLGGFVFGTISVMFLERLSIFKLEKKVQKRWQAWKRWRKFRKFSCLQGKDGDSKSDSAPSPVFQRAELKLLPHRSQENKVTGKRDKEETKLNAIIHKLSAEGAKCLTEEERNFLAARSKKIVK